MPIARASELVMEEVREAQERAASAEKKRDNALQEVEELKKRSSSDTGGASSEVSNEVMCFTPHSRNESDGGSGNCCRLKI